LKAYEQHREFAREKVGFFVVTVSKSRYEAKSAGRKFQDQSGDIAQELILKHGHRLKGRLLVSDDAGQIMGALEKGLDDKSVDALVFTGGTGVSPTDITIETVRPSFDKEVEGFGELFRAVSFRKIGFPAVLSRSTAGIARGKLVLCLPGSPDGVKTALKLFMKDIPHVVHVAAGKH